MGDFSVMGFVVDRDDAAVALLTSRGYQSKQVESGVEIRIEGGSGQLLDIRNILSTENINCEFSDIADTLYQA